MNDSMASQVAPPLASIDTTLVSLEMALQEREREIDLLRREVDRYRRQSEEADGRVAMVQAAFERHLVHCDRDDGAVQRLMAGLAEATVRRKDQALIIERREGRITALQKELDWLKGKWILKVLNPKTLLVQIRKAFSKNFS